MTPPFIDAVAIAASAGGVAALRTLLSAFPLHLPAVVYVVLHRCCAGSDVLAELLSRHCPLPVRSATEGMRPEPGTVVVAPAGRQLELGPDGSLSIRRTERVNFVRPSADVLFTSLAARHGPHTLGCVLSGTGRDGAEGAKAIRAAGGFVLAQAPACAAYPDMPAAAIETRKVDLVLPIERIGFAIASLVAYEEAAA